MKPNWARRRERKRLHEKFLHDYARNPLNFLPSHWSIAYTRGMPLYVARKELARRRSIGFPVKGYISEEK